MVKSMDKRNKMNLKQKYIYYGVALMLVALICVIGMKGCVLQRTLLGYSDSEFGSLGLRQGFLALAGRDLRSLRTSRKTAATMPP